MQSSIVQFKYKDSLAYICRLYSIYLWLIFYKNINKCKLKCSSSHILKVFFVGKYFLFFYSFIFKKCCCSITVISISPHCSPLPCPSPSPTFNPPPDVLAHWSFTYVLLDLILSLNFPCYPLLLPHWSRSVCSLFPSLWLYFVCLFILLIKFHL